MTYNSVWYDYMYCITYKKKMKQRYILKMEEGCVLLSNGCYKDVPIEKFLFQHIAH